MNYDPNSTDSKFTQILDSLSTLTSEVSKMKVDIADLKTQMLSAKMIAKIGRSILWTIAFVVAFKFGDISRLWKP